MLSGMSPGDNISGAFGSTADFEAVDFVIAFDVGSVVLVAADTEAAERAKTTMEVVSGTTL